MFARIRRQARDVGLCLRRLGSSRPVRYFLLPNVIALPATLTSAPSWAGALPPLLSFFGFRASRLLRT
jgi:hypothetical protein